MVTRNFLRYTFRDVISSRFRANLTHPADAALVALLFKFKELQELVTFRVFLASIYAEKWLSVFIFSPHGTIGRCALFAAT